MKTDEMTGEELRQKIRCLDCYSLLGNRVAMKKHISVHHKYLFNKKYTTEADTGAKDKGERELQCQVCHLYFEQEFGLANHYCREHFDLIRDCKGSDDNDDNEEEEGVVIRNLCDEMEEEEDVKILIHF